MPAASAARRSSGNRVIASLTLASLAYAVMQMMVVPALPAIEHDLGADAGGVAWLISAFLLSTAVSTPILGRLGDMYGKERMLVVVLAVFASGSVLAAFSTSLEMLIAARVVQGLGGAIFPLAFGIARDALPPEKLSFGLGLMSGSFGVGGAAGLILAGVIVDHTSWHGIFWVGILVPLAAIVCVRAFIPASPARERVQLDWLGAVLLAAGLLPLLLGVSRGGAWGWTSLGVLGLFAAGAALIGVWGWWELRRRAPLIDVRLLGRRAVWTVNAGALFVGFGMYAASYLIPQLVQADPAQTGFGFDASTTASGLFLLPAMTAGLIVGPLSGVLARRAGPKLPLVLGTATMAAGFALLAFAHDERWHVYLGAMLSYGLGLTLALTAMANLILVGVPRAQTGESTGINTMVRTVGGSLGSQVVAALVLTGSAAGTAAAAAGDSATDHGFTVAFGVCAVLLLLACALSAAVPATADE